MSSFFSRNHDNAFVASSSFPLYNKNEGVSGIHSNAKKSKSGAAAATPASWRQSRKAPRVNEARVPSSDEIFSKEERRPRTEGEEISEM